MSAAPRYIISKCVVLRCIVEIVKPINILTALRRGLDPIFAITVGLSAAVLRINRDEKEIGKSTSQTLESLRKRLGIAWEDVVGKSTAG
jgi:hypothetical protein